MVALLSFARLTPWDRIVAWYRESVFYDLFRLLSEDVFGVTLGDYANISLGATAGMTLRNIIFALALGVLIAAGAAAYTKRVPGGFIRRLLRMGATSPEQAVSLLETGYFRSVGVRWDLSRGGSLAKLVCRVGDDGKTLAGTVPEAAESALSEEPDGDDKPSLVARLTADDPRRSSSKPSVSPSASAEPVRETAPNNGDAHPDRQQPADSDKDPASSAAEPVVRRPVNFLSDRFYIPDSLRIRSKLRYENGGSGGRMFAFAVVLTVFAAFLLCRFLPAVIGLADKILSLF